MDLVCYGKSGIVPYHVEYGLNAIFFMYHMTKFVNVVIVSLLHTI